MIVSLEIDGQLIKVELTPGKAEGSYTVALNGVSINADARLLQPGLLSLLIDGRSYRCTLERSPVDPTTEGRAITVDGREHRYRLNDPRSLKARRANSQSADGAVAIKASMPGRVVRVLVEIGTEVEAQQGVLVIEAMKMQNELKAPKAGRVIEVRVAPGEAVASGQVLAIVE